MSKQTNTNKHLDSSLCLIIPITIPNFKRASFGELFTASIPTSEIFSQLDNNFSMSRLLMDFLVSNATLGNTQTHAVVRESLIIINTQFCDIALRIIRAQG